MFLTLALVLAADPQYVVENKCPQYTVVNKCPATAKAESVPYPRGYPVHQTRWTYPGEIHSHLKTGQHAGKWPAIWIDTLTRQQAESLHDDDHEGKVQWQYVPARPPAKPVQTIPVVPGVKAPYTSDPYCPPGASH